MGKQDGALVALDAETLSALGRPRANLVVGGANGQLEVLPEQLHDGTVREGAPVGCAGGVELESIDPVEAPEKLVEEPRLPHAGLAQHHHRAPLPGRRPAEGILQSLELLPAPGQRGQSPLLRHLQAGAALELARDRVRSDRVGLALDLELPEVLEREEPRSNAVRLLAHHDLAGLGDAQEPRREIGRVADGRIIHAEVPADRSDHDQPGVDSHPHPELGSMGPAHVGGERLELLLDRQRRAERPVGVILVGDGRSEQRHDPVTEELIDGPLVTVDGAENDLERPIHDRVNFLGVHPLRHRGEARDVREHDGDALSLALQGRLRSEDLLGEVLGSVGVRRGEFLRGGRAGAAALRAELGRESHLRPAAGAARGQRMAALLTELGLWTVVVATLGARHGQSLHRLALPAGVAGVREGLLNGGVFGKVRAE